MPRGVLRLLAVLLLAASVPLQGMAAGAVLCPALVDHEYDAALAHHAHDGAASHEKQHGEKSHCEPGASCCTPAFILGTVNLPIPPLHRAFNAFCCGVIPPGIHPEALDRPPLVV